MLLGRMLDEVALCSPQADALWFKDRRWTFGELKEWVDRLAGGLHQAGIGHGDRVAFFLPNCPELIFAYLACFKLGAVCVPLNYRYLRAEAEYAIRHSGSTSLLVHREKLSIANELPLDELQVQQRYLVGGTDDVDGFASFHRLLAKPGESATTRKFSEDSSCAILYTSGSTAKPKGVTYSHRTLYRNCDIQVKTGEFTAKDVHVVMTSVSHAAALSGQLLPNLLAGGTTVLLDRPTSADILEAITRHHATRIQMLPASLEDLLEHIEDHPTPLPSLKSCFVGGDSVPLDFHRRFEKYFGWQVSEVCGMTECLTYSMNPPFGEKRIGSVGKPVRETVIRIVGDEGQDLPIGEVGEIWIKNPAVMVGYWNDPEATSKVLRAGCMASGDLGRLDPDGYLWFVGRKKEIIIRGGSNISPLEVEAVINEHPAVHLCGVVGKPDPHFGQVVVAFVAMRDNVSNPPSAEELRQFVAARIASYKVPEQFHFLDEMPLNPTGKVDRKQLHRWVESIS
ncbi:MAG: class I adenylate-forming enzyme family protein [Planctomycetota bacterium]